MNLFKPICHAITIISISAIFTNASHAYQVTFQPRVTVTEEYTDNVDLSESDEESDFITTIQPGFTLSAIGQTKGLSISYDPAYSWYADHAEYDTLRHSANMTGYSLLSRNARIDITDTFLYTEEPLDSLDTVDIPDDRTGREPYYNNTATIALSNRFGPADVVTLAYQYAVLENEDEANQEEDSQEHTPSISWEYALSDRVINQGRVAFTRGEFDVADDFERYFSSLQLRWQATRNVAAGVSYEHTALFFDQVEDNNYHIDYPSLDLFYQSGADTNLSVSVGYLWIEREKEDDEEGILLSSEIAQIWPFRRGSFSINATSGYDEAFSTQDNLGLLIFYEGGAELGYEILEDILASISASYRRDIFLNTDDEREDTTTLGGVAISYNRIRYVSATVSYDYRLRDSSEEDQGYQENRISLRITFTPEQPIRLIK